MVYLVYRKVKKWRILLWVLCMSILSSRVSGNTDCLIKVTSCPQNLTAWYSRARQFNCTGEEGRVYTCILTRDDELVETCMSNWKIDAGATGCPMANICGKYGAGLVPLSSFAECLDNHTGCPNPDHNGYHSSQLFLYPRCLKTSAERYLDFGKPMTTPVDTPHTTPVSHLSNESTTASAHNERQTDVCRPVFLYLFVASILGLIISTICFITWIHRKKSSCTPKMGNDETADIAEELRLLEHKPEPQQEKKETALMEHKPEPQKEMKETAFMEHKPEPQQEKKETVLLEHKPEPQQEKKETALMEHKPEPQQEKKETALLEHKPEPQQEKKETALMEHKLEPQQEKSLSSDENEPN